MMIILPIFWFIVLFFNKITYGVASNVLGNEQRQLDKSLKILRGDFNKLIETIEDFAGDFLKQIQETGKFVENTYIGNNDYNWQDDDTNTIEKTSKHTRSPLPTIAETTKSILDKALTLPKLHFPKIPNLITKNIAQELSNDIEKRKKRSTQTIPQEFEIRPPAPMTMQVGLQRSAASGPEFLRFADRTTNGGGNQKEQDNFLNDNNAIRSAAQQTDITTNVGGDKNGGAKNEQNNFLQAKQSGQEETQTSGSTTVLPNQKTKDPLICTAKSQKEMDLEKQKMEELKEEVKKLNELVSLLKDQQKIINLFNSLDKHLQDNEVSDEKGNFENSINKSFLYRTLNQLQNKRRVDSLNSYDKDATPNIQGKLIKSDKSDIHIQNPGPTFKDLEKLKIDLRTTAENLNQTKEVLIKEKQREEDFEQELKRQSSELKFLKVMTESLYDMMGHKNEDHKGHNMYDHSKLRNSNLEDGDVDSLLASVHTPKTMPTAGKKYNDAATVPESFTSLSLIEDIPTDRPLTRDELLEIKSKQKFKKLMQEWEKDPELSAYLKKDAMIEFGKETEEGLRKLAKQDKDRYKKFFPDLNTRESNAEDNRGSDMHKILSILNRKENQNGNSENENNHNGKQINQNEDRNNQNNLKNTPNKENNTYLSTNARASSSGSSDDLAVKLKLLEALTKEGKSDDSSSNKEKELSEAMKKLLEPEKKSEDNQLDSLMALLKEKRDEPKPEKNISQENLKKLLKQLNTKPQTKTDDVDVESELRQLQKAISSLRPKEDSLLDNLDFNSLGNTGKGKQEGDIQSMLSQLIAQNGGGASANTGIDLGGTESNLDLSTIINANSGTSVSPGHLNGAISSHGGGKYTPQQLLQLSKIMGTNSFKGVAGSSYSALGGNSNPAVQQLLNQYLAPSHLAPHKGPNAYSNQIGSLNGLYNSYGTSQYPNSYSGGHNSNLYGANSYLDGPGINSYSLGSNSYHTNPNGYNLNSYGSNSNSYDASSNSYGPNNINSYNPNSNTYASGAHQYTSNLYGPNSNSYTDSLHPHGSNSYNPGPYSNSYPGFNSLGYDGATPSYEAEYHVHEDYGTRPNFLGVNSGSNYNSPYHSEPSGSYPGETNIPHFTIPALPTYDVSTLNSNPNNYPASKNGYQPTSYSNAASGGYSGGSQGLIDHHNDVGYGNYGSGGTGYQGSSDYSGVAQVNKIYGPIAEQNEAGAHQNYGKGFFPSTGTSRNIGGSYQGNNYVSKSYGGPSVDQSYGNGQNGEQYKYAMASDLTKQIESLESTITGLSGHDYSQTPEDKATVTSLEQRIYDLKGVINSLNKPSYGTQNVYHSKQPSYSPAAPYAQNQAPYKQPYADHASYGGGSQNGGTSTAYGSPSQSPYTPSASNGQTQTGHGSYSPYQAPGISPQPPYGAGSQPQTPYASTSPPQAPNPQPYQEPQPSYAPNQPNGPKYSPQQPNQHSNSSPPPYQPSPQVDTHSSTANQPTQPGNNPPYQPKAASEEDRSMMHRMRKILRKVRSTRRTKRQVDNIRAPEMPPQMPPQVGDADMSINMRQNYGGQESRPGGYNIGNDAFTQIANTFKKYLEENLIENEDENDLKRYQPTNNQENRNSAVEGLQEKLEFLKKQLESQQQSGKSLSSFFGSPGITNPFPPPPIPFGSNNNFLNSQFKSPGVTSLEKTFSDKKQDFFTQIVLKLLEKVLGTLPSVLHRLFGNLASTVGDSYGDSYSPLQSVFKNLGAVGYIPLLLIKFLDTTSVIVQHLGKNKLFKNFLLPAGAVAAAGLAILFLVYFYQQDEPYGYIGYQGNNYNKYPQHEPSSYAHNNYGSTDYNNNGNYKSDSSYYSSNHRSNMEPPPNFNDDSYSGNIRQIPYSNNPRTGNNPDFGGSDYFKRGDVNGPLRYTRGYYDYFEDRFRPNRNKNVNR